MGGIDRNFVVVVASSDGTADTSDYASVTEELTFQPFTGSSEECVTVSTVEDMTVEGDETFTLSIVDSDPMATVVDGDTVITILDDDELTVRFVETDYAVDEGDSTDACLEATGQIDRSFTVTVQSSDDTATTALNDYAAISQEVTFTAFSGSQEQCFPANSAPDTIAEFLEEYLITIVDADPSVRIGEPSTTRIRIRDDDVVSLRFERSMYSTPEGLAVELCLVAEGADSMGGIDSPFTARVEYDDISATAPGDYDAVIQNVSFTAFSSGSQRQCFPATTNQDDIAEGLESFRATIADTGDMRVISGRPAVAVVNIIDDDFVVVQFEESMYEGLEGERVEVCAVLAGTTSQSVLVGVDSADGSATAPDDYGSVTDIYIFEPPSTRECINVTIVDDNLFEDPENFFLSLSLPVTNLPVRLGTPNTTTVTIPRNDEPNPVFEMTMYTVPENDRTVPLCIDIGVMITEPQTYTINAEQKNPPEAQDADFGTSTLITVQPPGSRACIDFTDLVVDDAIAFEGNQAFTITVGSSMAMVTIVDDDEPTFVIPDLRVPEDIGEVEQCVTIVSPIEREIPLDCFSSDILGGATEGADYIGRRDSFLVQPGDTRFCGLFTIIADNVINEPDEAFRTTCQIVDSPIAANGTVTIIDVSPLNETVCTVSTPQQVSPFSRSTMYSFRGVCDHYLIAPTVAANGVPFSIILNFRESDLSNGRLIINYGDLQLLSTADRQREANLDAVSSPSPGVFVFPGNVVTTLGDTMTTVELLDIGVTLVDTFAPPGSEEIQVTINNVAQLPDAEGLCGTVDGELKFSESSEVANIGNSTQVQQFAMSWVLPPDEQSFAGTTSLCGAIIVNDSIIADPQFTVSLPEDGAESLCYEIHGSADKYFNLISDTCTSVNAHFTLMPDPARGTRMSRIGIHAVSEDNFAIIGSGLGGCVDIEIDYSGCSATVDGAPVDLALTVRDIRLRKFNNRWRVSVPNCERASLVMWITCTEQRLHFDVARGSNLKSTSHGLLGQLWNIPITVTVNDETNEAYVEVYEPGDDNYRRFPAAPYHLTWDHTPKRCYYVGNSQGGPERSHNPTESVIQGSYQQYETSGLFSTQFTYSKFGEDVC